MASKDSKTTRPKKEKDELVLKIRIPVGKLKQQGKIVGIAALILVAMVLAYPFISDFIPSFGGYSGDPASLEFYVMSQCPYGTQVEDAIAPVLQKFGEDIDFRLDFIARDLGNGNFKSLHGESEVAGNIVQLCAHKHEPEKWMNLVTCMNKDASAIPANWRTCSDQEGLDTDAIGECYAGAEGKQLLSDSIARTMAVGATGSPTIYLNGKAYSGARDSLSFTRAVCGVLEDHPECDTLPVCGSHADCTAEPGKVGWCENPGTDEAECVYRDPVEVEVIVLNDRTCTGCDTSSIIQTSRQLFKGATIRSVDVSSEEGKSIIKEYGIEKVPSYIFSSEVINTLSWRTNGNMATAFQKAGDGYRLRDEVTGATHYADPEARAAYLESLGITLGDNKPQVDFFVMSYCPYGNQAEEALKPVLELLGDTVELKPHYVIYSNYAGGGPSYCIDAASRLCSMHGVTELNQNIRERCVLEEYGIAAWFDFAIEMNSACTYQNADTCWTPVAEGLGYDTDAVQACYDTNAEAYAGEDLELGTLFGATGSPAVYIDGESYSGPRTGAGYSAAVCAKFDTPPGECSDIPQSEAPAPAPTGGCG